MDVIRRIVGTTESCAYALQSLVLNALPEFWVHSSKMNVKLEEEGLHRCGAAKTRSQFRPAGEKSFAVRSQKVSSCTSTKFGQKDKSGADLVSAVLRYGAARV
jgi:hypothetical protein